MAERVYYLGLVRGSRGYWANGHRETTVVLEARACLDNLSPDLWEYLGPRVTTKASLKAKRVGILAWVNATFGTAFTALVVE